MGLSYPGRQRDLERFIEKLGLSKKEPISWDLLDLALTHPSVSTDQNYEQLEFVGDAVVRMVVSEFLYEKYPHAPVGEFAAIRSILVSDRSLSEIANSYGLGRYLLLAGSAAHDQTGEESRLADGLEAVLGVLYLSTHTLKLIRPWLDPHFEKLSLKVRQDPAFLNYKAALQEWTQAQYKILPEYSVKEVNKIQGHSQRFNAEIRLKGRLLGTGSGRSIKAAEQAAAQAAFEQLSHHQQDE